MHCLALALALSLAAGSVVTSTSAEAGFLLDAVKEGVKEGVKQGVTDGVKQVVTDSVKKVAAKGEEVAKKGALRTRFSASEASPDLLREQVAFRCAAAFHPICLKALRWIYGSLYPPKSASL